MTSLLTFSLRGKIKAIEKDKEGKKREEKERQEGHK